MTEILTEGLRVTDLSFAYRRRIVLDRVAFTARPGQILGLLGPNGSGKSTLLKVLAGIVRPGAGTAVFEGTDLLTMPRRERARLVAHVPQSADSLYTLTVGEAVMLGRTPYLGARPRQADREQVARSVRAVGLESLVDRPVDQLSGGQRQRVLIARAMAQQPRLMILDEPTSALDLAAQVDTMHQLRHLVADHGVCAVMAVHDMNLAARYCHRLATLGGGRITREGVPSEVIDADVIADVYGIAVEVTRHRGIPEVRPAESCPR